MSMMNVTGSRLVAPEGSKDAKICLIGEAPGRVEIMERRPFRGPAGRILEECMHAAGLIRSECYITNVFKFQVRKSGGNIIGPHGETLYKASKGFTEAAEPYLEELREELEGVKANVLVPLGNPALTALTGKVGINKWRGSILESTMCPGRKTIPTIHPSSSLQSGEFTVRYLIIFDLRRAKRESTSPSISYPIQTLVVDKSYDYYTTYLNHLYKQGLEGKRINFDIEVVNQEISCISFATDISRGVSLPFHNRWKLEEEAHLWRLIAKIMEDERVKKVNQNILFDAWMLAYKNRIVIAGRMDDPMAANHIIYPDFKKDLGFLTTIHTRVPYYKDEGKVWFKGIGSDITRFWRYNAQDSCVSIACMDALDEELDREGYRDMYERTVALYPVLLYMMVRGLRVRKDGIDKAREDLTAQRDEAQAELDEMVGRPLNVNSSKQCIQYFYVDKGIPPYYSRKTGKMTTDNRAMKRIARGTASRPGLREAWLVQRIRGLNKLISTYINVELDEDNRIRCSWNPRGTTTGRLSSSQTIFGTGMNLQNVPPEFKQFIIPDEGHVLVEIDKVNAEWVVVAYASGDARMISVVEEGLDPHATTGSLITGLPVELVQQERKLVGHETDPVRIKRIREEKIPEVLKGEFLPSNMSIRQCGKKSNHGCNYGMGYRRFSLENDIPEKEGKLIVQRYHDAYVGIKNTFHANVRYQLGKNRTVTNCFGDKRRFLGRWGPELFNQAYDYVAQSTIAHLVNAALIEIYRDREDGMDKLDLLAQIHDSILFQYPIDDIDRLKGVIDRCVKHLDPEMSYLGRTFRIKSEVMIGFNWRDMVTVKSREDIKEVIEKRAE